MSTWTPWELCCTSDPHDVIFAISELLYTNKFMVICHNTNIKCQYIFFTNLSNYLSGGLAWWPCNLSLYLQCWHLKWKLVWVSAASLLIQPPNALGRQQRKTQGFAPIPALMWETQNKLLVVSFGLASSGHCVHLLSEQENVTDSNKIDSFFKGCLRQKLTMKIFYHEEQKSVHVPQFSSRKEEYWTHEA